MDITPNIDRPCWFVGASFGGADDQFKRFVETGIWETGYKEKYAGVINSVQVGDRIAIKSSYTKKKNLPFEGNGNTASVMLIKAIGVVTENPKNGCKLTVNWTVFDTKREWYFYTHRSTLWKVVPSKNNWYANELIAYTFDNAEQDYGKFVNDPYWKSRFGIQETQNRFQWTNFYEEMATALLEYKENRESLLDQIYKLADGVAGLGNLGDKYDNESAGPLRDICPFTVMGMFNRSLTLENRKSIAAGIAKILRMKTSVPDSFDGVPLLNNQRSWFFGFEYVRTQNDIDSLWSFFELALSYADNDLITNDEFAIAYNKVAAQYAVGWNLSMGLFWMRPWFYMTLDGPSRAYISRVLNVTFSHSGANNRCSGDEYLELREILAERFKERTTSINSFPKLSFIAWNGEGEVSNDIASSNESPEVEIKLYTLKSIFEDGCFAEQSVIERAFFQLKKKKNLILQGPPGTGKTWLSKRLGYALIGRKEKSNISALQFHPNISYEDFVRGWRPTGEGRLELVDGPFLKAVSLARKNPSEPYVVIIEEINRGNPAQIFGELLTLLESNKRSSEDALMLCYSREGEEPFFLPENLYVIGTMNIADRSLALVDFALRRRFAFLTLEPKFDETWFAWVSQALLKDSEQLNEIQNRILELNRAIAKDATLGSPYCVGHSYLTPSEGVAVDNVWEWYSNIVESELLPLLAEYWFDEPNKLSDARKLLLHEAS